MTEPVEVGIARMQEQLKAILEDASEAKQARKEQYKVTQEMQTDLASVKSRLEMVEKQIASSAPTLAEFVVMKHRIQGVGSFGRWLWGFFGFVTGLIAWVIGAIPALQSWLIGK